MRTVLQVVLAFGMTQGLALAQAPYPSKPVWVISPLGSGGAVEIMGRVVTRKMSERIGQQFLIESRPGAGGVVGHEAAARAAPDGYTLLLTGSGYTIMPYLMSGELQLIMSNTISALPHVKSGKAKALGVSSLRRLAALPDVPTISESGVPDFHAPVWTAIFAPAKTPPEILARLNAEVVKAVNDPEMVKRAEAEGGTNSVSRAVQANHLQRAEQQQKACPSVEYQGRIGALH